MLSAALLFFVLALISYLFGAWGLVGLTVEIGKLLLLVFIVLSVISLIAGLVGRNRNVHP